MGAGLLQMAAYGSQDVFLYANPEITLFKTVYKRYTHFSMETVEQQIINLNFSSRVSTIELETNADLLYKAVLVLTLKEKTAKKWGYVKRLGHAIIDTIKISIGSTNKDEHTGEWLENITQLTQNSSHTDGYNKMIGDVSIMTSHDVDHPEYSLYIPLHFWFTKTPSLAYPICVNTTEKIQIQIKIKDKTELINYPEINQISDGEYPEIASSKLLFDVIYLDDAEFKFFQTKDHEYLIESLSIIQDAVTSEKDTIELNLSEKCKFLQWNVVLNKYSERNSFLIYAYGNEWEKAREDFGKLIYLVTRENLTDSTSNNPYIVLPDTFLNIGDGPNKVTGGGTLLDTLADKVKGIILFAKNESSENRASATVDNVVLTENSITFEDMSYTITELQVSATSEQNTFLSLNSQSVINRFNSGNFIDGSDNPIIKSGLRINDQNIFKSLENKYFNYIQPHYYFENIPKDGINVYSFSLDPQNTQPTGYVDFNTPRSFLSLDFGKNGNIVNNLNIAADLFIFAQNYDILEVQSKQANQNSNDFIPTTTSIVYDYTPPTTS
uniref:Major capsid protein n=1 Tax=Megaviridae environmental sample TaxID=1737588 RepID=A0A5J6VKT5_9VIRU|nr:MAG: major capsid protein [Megaviridae environmental sample]